MNYNIYLLVLLQIVSFFCPQQAGQKKVFHISGSITCNGSAVPLALVSTNTSKSEIYNGEGKVRFQDYSNDRGFFEFNFEATVGDNVGILVDSEKHGLYYSTVPVGENKSISFNDTLLHLKKPWVESYFKTKNPLVQKVRLNLKRGDIDSIFFFDGFDKGLGSPSFSQIYNKIVFTKFKKTSFSIDTLFMVDNEVIYASGDFYVADFFEYTPEREINHKNLYFIHDEKDINKINYLKFQTITFQEDYYGTPKKKKPLFKKGESISVRGVVKTKTGFNLRFRRDGEWRQIPFSPKLLASVLGTKA